jgi:hypothetical protein
MALFMPQLLYHLGTKGTLGTNTHRAGLLQSRPECDGLKVYYEHNLNYPVCSLAYDTPTPDLTKINFNKKA